MWWDYQNLNTPRVDKSGKKWNFRVWHDVFTIRRTVSVARIFFWDEKRDSTGVVLRGPDVNQHVHDLQDLIRKLVANREFRVAHEREIRFPLERHYSDYGAFPEEAEILSMLETAP